MRKGYTKRPTRARRPQEKEMRRKAIIDATEAAIKNSGLDKFTFGEIAKRSRLSRALIYVYFPKREDLIHAVCERALGELKSCFEQIITQKKSGLEQILGMCRAYRTFSVEEKLYFSVLTEADSYDIHPANMNEIECAVDRSSQEVLGLVAAAIQRGQEDGTVRKDIGPPMLATMSIWAFAHGLIQICAGKQAMLKEHYEIEGDVLMEQGYALIRASLVLPGSKL
jgi:AcrR family transcriptional regulator